MARCRNRTWQERSATEARLREAAVRMRAAAEETTGCPASMEEDVPMCRYAHPIPIPACGLGCQTREQTILLEQLLEQTCRQNQTLLDLLGAVNALTAAMLSLRGGQ